MVCVVGIGVIRHLPLTLVLVVQLMCDGRASASSSVNPCEGKPTGILYITGSQPSYCNEDDGGGWLLAYANANNHPAGEKIAGLEFKAAQGGAFNTKAYSWYASRWGATVVKDASYFGKPWDPEDQTVALTPEHMGSLNVAELYSKGMTDVKVVFEAKDGRKHMAWCDTSEAPFTFEPSAWTKNVCKRDGGHGSGDMVCLSGINAVCDRTAGFNMGWAGDVAIGNRYWDYAYQSAPNHVETRPGVNFAVAGMGQNTHVNNMNGKDARVLIYLRYRAVPLFAKLRMLDSVIITSVQYPPTNREDDERIFKSHARKGTLEGVGWYFFYQIADVDAVLGNGGVQNDKVYCIHHHSINRNIPVVLWRTGASGDLKGSAHGRYQGGSMYDLVDTGSIFRAGDIITLLSKQPSDCSDILPSAESASGLIGATAALAAALLEGGRGVQQRRLCEMHGCVAHYPLDGDVRDVSGNGNHGLTSAAIDFPETAVPFRLKDAYSSVASFSESSGCRSIFSCTFLATGCMSRNAGKIIGHWATSGLSNEEVFEDMHTFCTRARDDLASSDELDLCCGDGKICRPICSKQSDFSQPSSTTTNIQIPKAASLDNHAEWTFACWFRCTGPPSKCRWIYHERPIVDSHKNTLLFNPESPFDNWPPLGTLSSTQTSRIATVACSGSYLTVIGTAQECSTVANALNSKAELTVQTGVVSCVAMVGNADAHYLYVPLPAVNPEDCGSPVATALNNKAGLDTSSGVYVACDNYIDTDNDGNADGVHMNGGYSRGTSDCCQECTIVAAALNALTDPLKHRSDQEWHHAAWTKSPRGGIMFYIDTKLVSTEPSFEEYGESTPTTEGLIGGHRYAYGGNPAEELFVGLVSDVYIFHKVLEAPAIAELAAVTTTTPSTITTHKFNVLADGRYYTAASYCTSLSAQLATSADANAEMVNRGKPFSGQDSWTPVSDGKYKWMQTGDSPHTFGSIQYMNPALEWYTDEDKHGWKREFYCSSATATATAATTTTIATINTTSTSTATTATAATIATIATINTIATPTTISASSAATNTTTTATPMPAFTGQVKAKGGGGGTAAAVVITLLVLAVAIGGYVWHDRRSKQQQQQEARDAVLRGGEVLEMIENPLRRETTGAGAGAGAGAGTASEVYYSSIPEVQIQNDEDGYVIDESNVNNNVGVGDVVGNAGGGSGNTMYAVPNDQTALEGHTHQPPPSLSVAAEYSTPTDTANGVEQLYRPPDAAAYAACNAHAAELYQIPMESGGVHYASRDFTTNAGEAYAAAYAGDDSTEYVSVL